MFESYGGSLKAGGHRPVGKSKALASNPELRSMLVWGEHCTECAMPSCYSSCEFYLPRADLKCQRFRERPSISAANDGGEEWMTVHFGKWAALMATGPIPMGEARSLAKAETVDRRISDILWAAPLPFGFKTRLVNWWSKKKVRILSRWAPHSAALATHLTLEVFNHETYEVGATLSIRRKNLATKVFQHRLCMPPGHSDFCVSLGQFFAGDDSNTEYFTNLTLDADIEDAVLSIRDFGLATFRDALPVVTYPKNSVDKQVRLAKCVVWDLDNTVWKGTLVEDGINALILRPEIVSLIKTLDERGVLQSVASKNNPEDALAALERFELKEYFLHPQISWNPKSQSLQMIRDRLNIGIDTFFFVDDQPFERAEVNAALPEVTSMDEQTVLGLLDLPEFNLPITEESRVRRKYYQEQIQREGLQAQFIGDYEAFLRDSKMILTLSSLNSNSLDRAYELTQRTNQMNFAGGRFTREELAEIGRDRSRGTFVMSCADRFGEYGVVGFAILELENGLVEEAAFSCRIQAKRVEHAFFLQIGALLKRLGHKTMSVKYIQTKKNTPVGQVFEDLGFIVDPGNETVRVLSVDTLTSQDLVEVKQINDVSL